MSRPGCNGIAESVGVPFAMHSGLAKAGCARRPSVLAGEAIPEAAGMLIGGESSRNTFELRWMGEPHGGRSFQGHDRNHQISVSRYALEDAARILQSGLVIRQCSENLKSQKKFICPSYVKPERKSPSIPTVEMLSPLEYMLFIEKSFDLPCAYRPRTPQKAGGPLGRRMRLRSERERG